MALKVNAIEKLQKIGNYAGTYRYVMSPELYSTLDRSRDSDLLIWSESSSMKRLLSRTSSPTWATKQPGRSHVVSDSHCNMQKLHPYTFYFFF